MAPSINGGPTQVTSANSTKEQVSTLRSGQRLNWWARVMEGARKGPEHTPKVHFGVKEVLGMHPRVCLGLFF